MKLKKIQSDIYLADFLKINLTKFAVIWVKKRQKARFSSPSSKIIVTKEKGKEKERGEGKDSFYNSYFGEKTVERKRFIWR